MGLIKNMLTGSVAIASDYADVTNIRNLVYKKKLEIIKTPMVREIIVSTFAQGLPAQIWINGQGVFARPFDSQSNTYHPNGVLLYSPEVTFDYIVSMAILLIIQDLYPNVYEVNHVTTAQLNEQLQNGTWCGTLTMKDDCLYKTICPAFDITNIENIPSEKLPLTLEDNYTNKSSVAPKISLTCGIIAVVLSLLGGLVTIVSMFCAIVGAMTGIYSILTTGKGKKKPRGAIWGIVLSIVSWVLPLFIGIAAFLGNL